MPIYPTKTVDYNFDNPACYNGSGTVVTDLQGNLDLNFVGTPTFTSSPGNGSYFSFTAATVVANHLESAFDATFNGSFDFSMSYCLRAKSNPVINVNYGGLNSSTYQDQNTARIQQIATSPNVWYSAIGYGGENITPTPVVINEWVVVTVTSDYTNNQLKTYINGTLVKTDAFIGSYTFINPQVMLGYVNSSPYLGTGLADSDIKAFSVWKNVVLTPTQVQDVANEFLQYTNPPFLILDATNSSSYPGTGNTWFDLGPNNNDLTLYGNTTWQNVSGVKYFHFDGTNSYAYNPSISIGTTNIFTIDIWFQGTDIQSGAFVHTTGVPAAGTLPLLAWNGYYGTGIYAECGGNVAGHMIVTPPVLNNWYNITMTADGSSISYYLDGTLNYSTSQGGAYLPTSACELSIGNLAASVGANAWFEGNVGYYAIYQSAIGSTQIASNYTTNLAKFTPGPPPGYGGNVGGRQFGQGFNG